MFKSTMVYEQLKLKVKSSLFRQLYPTDYTVRSSSEKCIYDVLLKFNIVATSSKLY